VAAAASLMRGGHPVADEAPAQRLTTLELEEQHAG
jgi:hypothetical protein